MFIGSIGNYLNGVAECVPAELYIFPSNLPRLANLAFNIDGSTDVPHSARGCLLIYRIVSGSHPPSRSDKGLTDVMDVFLGCPGALTGLFFLLAAVLISPWLSICLYIPDVFMSLSS